MEYTTEFQDLDTLVNAYDAEGVGPLRKGERPFQWESVASASEALLARSADLRVAIWLLRACLEQRGVSGLLDGLSRICELLTLPEIELFPQPLEGEPVREAHAVSLAWLGSAALLHQLRNAPLSPNVPITIADMRKDEGLAQTLDVSSQTEWATKLQSGPKHLEHITDILKQGQAEHSINMAPLQEELASVYKSFHATDVPQNKPDPSTTEASRLQHALPLGAAIHKREEAQQALSRLIAYFKEYEPGHPAPLLLLRVQRMLGASFEDLMGELYAEAAQLIARIEKPQAP